MQAREFNGSPSSIYGHNNSESTYNQFTEIEQSRSSESLSARSQSDISQTSTNCTDMDGFSLRQIREELQKINRRLNKQNEYDRLVNAIKQAFTPIMEDIKKGQELTNKMLTEMNQKLQYISKKMPAKQNKKLLNFLLDNPKNLQPILKKIIQQCIALKLPVFQILSIYLRIQMYLEPKSSQQLLIWRLIKIQYITDPQIMYAEKLLIESERSSDVQYWFEIVAEARRQNQNDPGFFNIQELVGLKEKEIGFQLQLTGPKYQRFRSMILVLLSDYLQQCRKVKKIIEIICVAKHMFYGTQCKGVSQKLNLAQTDLDIIKNLLTSTVRFG